VTWNWGDGTGSGLDSANCPATTVVSVEQDLSSVRGTCSDVAGNQGEASVTVGVDETAPALAPSLAATLLLGASVTATPNATDALSGVASQSCASVDTTTIGTRAVICTAVDKAGNTASSSKSYTVAAGFGGYVDLKASPLSVKSNLVVRFTLRSATAPLTAAASSAMAANGQVRVQLGGPGTGNTAVANQVCSWNKTALSFSCDFKPPSNVKTGAANPYRLVVQEKAVGGTFFDAPGSANPATVWFK
jgi:hypothetical protein